MKNYLKFCILSGLFGALIKIVDFMETHACNTFYNIILFIDHSVSFSSN